MARIAARQVRLFVRVVAQERKMCKGGKDGLKRPKISASLKRRRKTKKRWTLFEDIKLTKTREDSKLDQANVGREADECGLVLR